MASDQSLQTLQLGYTYANRSIPALRDVNLTVEPGQLTLLVGESGSGKTTLLRCLNGLIPHAYSSGTRTGDVVAFTEFIQKSTLAQLSLLIGTVLQEPEKQMVSPRVEGEIAFGPENLGLPRAEIAERVRAVATRMGITHLLQRETHTLSGGERQKLAIAGVLVMQPRALLLDEPLASLDPVSAREVLTIFRGLADDGLAVLMIEHRVREALAARPERVAILDEGALVFNDSGPAFDAWRASQPLVELPKGHGLSGTPSGSPLLALKQVSFEYAGSERGRLHGINLEVRAGEVLVLMGPNGAGKSTLSKLAIGINRPTAGQVQIGGADARNLSVAQIAQRVGYCFQQPSAMLFANTLREELVFGPRNTGMPKENIDAAVTRAMEMVDLAQLDLGGSPFALSSGQQKRVSIASVLAMQPKLLILDEPTAGLDAATTTHLMTQILRDPAGPQGMMMITHDLDLARRVATRVVLLHEGSVIADGDPAELLYDDALLARCRLQ